MRRKDPSAAELTDSGGAPEGRGARTENQGGNGGAVVFETSGAVLLGEDPPPPPNESSTGGGGGGNAEEEAKTQPRWKLGTSACTQLSTKIESMEIAPRKLFDDAREGRELTDMEFALDSGLKVRGHKSWLMARSDYIRAMLSSGMQEAQTGVVPVRQCADGTFLVLLEYLYTGKAILSGLGLCYTTSFLELLEMFQIEGLQEETSGKAFEALTLPPGTLWKAFEALTLPPGTLWKAGRKMFQDAKQGAELTDMEFVLDSGLKIRGHKSWLMARCETLADKIRESTTGVVPVRECSDGAFLALLEFVYTGRLTGDTCMGQDWEELWMIAERFGMKGMGEKLMDAVTLDEAEKAAHVAVKRGMTRLVGICVKTVRPPPTVVLQYSVNFSKEEAVIVINVMFVICDSDYGKFEGNGMFPILQDGLQTLCRVMASQRNDAEQQIRGCIALRNAARSISNSTVHDPDSWDYELVNPGQATFAVMGALNHHGLNPQVQIHGFEALSALLVTVRLSTMGECVMDGPPASGSSWFDGISLILAALENHASIAEVQAAGCQLFVQLWINYGGRMWEDPAGPDADKEPRITLLIQAISTAVVDHKGSAEVQRMGNAALFYLVLGADAPGRPWDESNGGVEALVEALRSADTDNKRVHRNGTQALQELVQDGAENRQLAVQAGGIEAVVKALGTDTSDVQLQFDGCCALTDLITSSDEYRSRAGQAGAVEAVIDALKQHKEDNQVTVFGCLALAELSSGHVGNRRRAGQAGGVAVVIDAFKARSTGPGGVDVVFQSTFCAVLHNLVDGDDVNRASAVRAGGIEAVVKALGTDISNDQLQFDGCWALTKLIKNSDVYRSRAGQAGAVEAVIDALKQHKEDNQVTVFGCLALAELSSGHVGNRRRAGQAGGVAVVIDAFKARSTGPSHGGDDVVFQGTFCAVLHNLVDGDDVNRASAVRAGGIEAVVKALGTDISDVQLQVEGCWALSRLITSSDVYRSRAGQAGAVEAVIEALKQHKEDDRVQYIGLNNLIVLVSDLAELIHRAVDAGAVQVVEEAFKNHKLDQTGKQTCDDLLSQFNRRLSKRSRRATERFDD